MFGWKLVRELKCYPNQIETINEDYKFERIDDSIREIHRLISSLYSELGYYKPDPYNGDLKLCKKPGEEKCSVG
jgi:hypothetical protein